MNPGIRVGVVDYGSGNLRSVTRALTHCGVEPVIFSGENTLGNLDAVVLPGVGSFGDCVRNLSKTGLMDPLRDWIRADRPFLGICLGYQLLFEGSEESPGVPGLGVIAGRVRRFPQGTLKVPQMGWNSITPCHDQSVYRGLGSAPYFYFVHSYYPEPEDSELVNAVCDYGISFAAGIGRGNLVATQFHPEKSQQAGLGLITNFLDSIHAPVSRN